MSLDTVRVSLPDSSGRNSSITVLLMLVCILLISNRTFEGPDQSYSKCLVNLHWP